MYLIGQIYKYNLIYSSVNLLFFFMGYGFGKSFVILQLRLLKFLLYEI